MDSVSTRTDLKGAKLRKILGLSRPLLYELCVWKGVLLLFWFLFTQVAIWRWLLDFAKLFSVQAWYFPQWIFIIPASATRSLTMEHFIMAFWKAPCVTIHQYACRSLQQRSQRHWLHLFTRLLTRASTRFRCPDTMIILRHLVAVRQTQPPVWPQQNLAGPNACTIFTAKAVMPGFLMGRVCLTPRGFALHFPPQIWMHSARLLEQSTKMKILLLFALVWRTRWRRVFKSTITCVTLSCIQEISCCWIVVSQPTLREFYLTLF